MPTPIWNPGRLYQPGDIVQRRTAPPVVQDAPTNPSFESGGTGWTFDGTWSVSGFTPGIYPAGFDGPNSLAQTGAWIGTDNYVVNGNQVPVVPGQVINARCVCTTTGQPVAGRQAVSVAIYWYNSVNAYIGKSDGNHVTKTSFGWAYSTVAGTAPPGAAFAAIAGRGQRNEGAYAQGLDAFSWDYTYSEPADGLVFRAIQTNAAYSGVTEPTWPTVIGNTVVDNGVTWEAFLSPSLTWQANHILISGATEPTWPVDMGSAIVDNTIAWIATTGQITDAKCPNTRSVAIASSKVFAGDDDIVAFSATINPLDWSTRDDAGYLPFGLQTYGSTAVTALGLYRGNLVVFNSQSFQMWQVDQDPANMALLDAVPIGCTFPRSVQPLANDLVFLSAVGVRNVGIAGASTNLQAEGVGEPIDTLVTAKIRAGTYEPIGLFYPAAGQYWIIFGAEAFVLTINGAKAKSWSRYIFPFVITDWTLHGSDLYLRSADHKVLAIAGDVNVDAADGPAAYFTRDLTSVFTITTATFAGGGPSEYIGYASDSGLTGAPLGSATGQPLTGYAMGQTMTVTRLYSFGYTPDEGLARNVVMRVQGSASAPGEFFSSLSFTDAMSVVRTLNYADAVVTPSGLLTEYIWTITPHADVFANAQTYTMTLSS